jgi:hypothetical protein
VLNGIVNLLSQEKHSMAGGKCRKRTRRVFEDGLNNRVEEHGDPETLPLHRMDILRLSCNMVDKRCRCVALLQP